MPRRALLAAVVLVALFPDSLQALALQVRARNSLPISRAAVPVTWSIPLSRADGIREVSVVRLLRGGVEVSAQFTPLARWGGAVTDATRPVSWLLVDARLDFAPNETATLLLQSERGVLPASPLRVVRNDADAIVVATGAATYEMSKRTFRLFDRVTLSSGETFSGGELRFRGLPVEAPVTLAVEQQGRERISLLGRGVIAGDLEYAIRIHFYRELAEVKIDFRLENLAQPLTIDGQPQDNDLGSQGSVSFDDFSLLFATRGGTSYEAPAGELGTNGSQQGTFTQRIALVQESSGDEHWDALRSMAPRLQAAVTKRASTVIRDGVATDGPNQIAGWLDAGGVTIALFETWQNFPKALRASTTQVEAALFPSEYATDHQLRAGEFKTHTLWVRHHASVSDVALRARSFLAQVHLLTAPEHAGGTLAAGLMAPRAPLFADYEAGVDYQLDVSPQWREGEYPAHTVIEAISLAQCYGWTDWGDVPTDFEVATSPYNMKYDSVRGLLHQAMRSDDDRWWTLGFAAARHVADIDVHHSRVRGRATQRRWFEGGIYGHGYHEEDGRLNPHRNYMNPSTSMAGPASGMLMWALASGDTLLMESAIEAADNIYWKTTNTNYNEAMEGAATCALSAGLQLCGDSCEGFEPADVSRTGGHVAEAMIAAYRATGDAAYLDLVRRLATYVNCVEGSVIPPTCNRFHMQAIFVRAIGHYLIFREAAGLGDDAAARELLRRRIDYMTNTLWDPSSQRFRMCYYDDVVDTTLAPIEDNWLFAVADAFAAGAIVLNRPELLTNQGQALFRYGAANQFYAGSAISYHSAKEYVNQVGFGQLFLWGWSLQTDQDQPRRRPVRRP